MGDGLPEMAQDEGTRDIKKLSGWEDSVVVAYLAVNHLGQERNLHFPPNVQ